MGRRAEDKRKWLKDRMDEKENRKEKYCFKNQRTIYLFFVDAMC